MSYLRAYREQLERIEYRGPSGLVRRYLNGKALRRGQRDRHGLFLPRVIELAGVQPNDVLELGCGSGWAMTYRGPRYFGVDRSADYRADIEARGIRFFEADLARDPIPMPSASVDMVMLNHLIEHLPDPEHIAREMRRVLRRGGFAYIRTPNIERVGAGFWNDYTHVKPYTVAGLTHLMQAFGFEAHRVLYSDHGRISLDIATGGRLRRALFGRTFGGAEIEALYRART